MTIAAFFLFSANALHLQFWFSAELSHELQHFVCTLHEACNAKARCRFWPDILPLVLMHGLVFCLLLTVSCGRAYCCCYLFQCCIAHTGCFVYESLHANGDVTYQNNSHMNMVLMAMLDAHCSDYDSRTRQRNVSA